MKLITDSNLELVIQAFYDRILEEFSVVDSAHKLETGRNLTIGEVSKVFDGTQDLFWSLTDIGIGSPSNLTTSNKSNVVNAINELNANKASIAYVDNAVENVSIDDVVTASEFIGNIENIENDYVTQSELEEALANIGNLDIGQGGGSSNGTVSSGIAVNSTYVSDANDTNSIIGYYPTNDNTLNLPAMCYNAGDEEYSLWGILFTQVEPIYKTLVQQYIPTWGAWQNITFTRTYNKDDGFSPWNCHLDSSEWSAELQTNNKTLIGAINELFTSANNGKNLIASAIGEPLSAEDTFQAMSDDINGLLSTFKTNMMNNGVSVNGGDKFKQLIEKLANLSDNEGNKLQFAMGNGSVTPGYHESYQNTTFPIDFGFAPSVIFLEFAKGTLNSNQNKDFNSTVVCGDMTAFIVGFTSTSVTISSFSITSSALPFTWYAIGAGAEDTTLRDSLASILQDAGVEVTNEDDMASLISKVDTKLDNSGGLDIISATTLPGEGKENQLCILTDTPVNKFVISNDSSNPPSDGILLKLSTSSDFPISVTSGNITTQYLFDSIHQNGQVLESYFYTNNRWNKVTEGLEVIFIMNNRVFNNTTVFGNLTSGTQFQYNSTERALILYKPSNWWATGTFANRIDFSNYTTLTVTAYCANNMAGSEFYAGVFGAQHNTGDYSNKQTSLAATSSVVLSTTSKEYTFDISSWNCSGYLGFAQNAYYNIFITDLNLTKE